MEEWSGDTVIIGAGLTGLALAAQLKDRGVENVIILETDEDIGGLLRWLKHLKLISPFDKNEILPTELLDVYRSKITEMNIQVLTNTTAIKIEEGPRVISVNPKIGVLKINAKKVVIATGGREINQYDLRILGSRPSGIFTSLTAIQLIRRFNKKIGKDVVLYGNNEILVEAYLWLKEIGMRVKAIVCPENRKLGILEAISDEGIPFYRKKKVVFLDGLKRLQSITISDENGDMEKIMCDTLILGFGFTPDITILANSAGEIDLEKKVPQIDEKYMTSIKNVFACGHFAKRYTTMKKAIEETITITDKIIESIN